MRFDQISPCYQRISAKSCIICQTASSFYTPFYCLTNSWNQFNSCKLNVLHWYTSLWSRNPVMIPWTDQVLNSIICKIRCRPRDIVTGQTALAKSDADILSKDFFTEGKIWQVSYPFSESSWQPKEDIFSTKDVFKYEYFLICYFRKAIRLIGNRVMKLHTRQITKI